MTAAPASEGEPARDARRVRRVRSLPGGRAVVGALLIAAAAVATFAAYLNATAEPTTEFLVATEAIEPGTRFASVDELTAVMGAARLELIPPLDSRALPVAELDALVGRVLVSPLQPGDLVTRTALVDDGGVDGAQTMSFSLPRTAAVAGTLRPGERIDVLATFADGGDVYTAYVARGVPLLRVTATDGGPLGSAAEVLLTVALTDLVDVQAMGHAVNTADVFVTRSTAAPGDQDAAPGAFRSEPGESGPLPEGAISLAPDLGTDADVADDAEDPGSSGSAPAVEDEGPGGEPDADDEGAED